MALPRRGGRAAHRGVAAAAAALLTATRGARALDNGLARTPQMGYNTWNDYRCKDINATNIAAVADAMVSNGLRDAGARGRIVSLGERRVRTRPCGVLTARANAGDARPWPQATST